MSRAESPLRDRMIFNVGSRRSGTFWLQRIVTSHPEVCAVPSESSLFSHGIAPLHELFDHGARSQARVGGLYIERPTLLDATRDFCDVALGSHLERGSRYLAERSALHVRHIDLIGEVYPDARVIHIIRDGRDVARSIVAQPWGPDTIAGAAEEWRSSVTAGRAAGLGPQRYRELRYEDLLARPEPVIAALFEWLELPLAEGALEQAVAEAGRQQNVDKHGQPGVATEKWRREWSAEDVAEFDDVAGDLLAELGYEASEPDGRWASRRGAAGADRSPLRERVRRAVRGGRRGSHRAWRDFTRRQRLADRALSAMLASRPHDLMELLAPDALVRIVAAGGIEAQRGSASRELLERTIAEDAPLAGRQSLGHIYPGNPTVGYVLSLELNGGPAADRAVFITIGGDRVTELTVYQLPLGER